MTREYGGKELAKVLIYYGLIADVVSSDFNIICPFHEDVNPSMRICLTDGSSYKIPYKDGQPGELQRIIKDLK